MRVKKRNNEEEDVSFDKVKRRLSLLSNDLNYVDIDMVSQMVISRIYDGVKTSELDELAAQICSNHVTEHPDYGILASKLIISNHQKKTSPSFSETMTILYNAIDKHNKHNPLISEDLYNTIMANKEKLNDIIDYSRDFNIDYFGFKTLERSYLLRVDNKPIERPQDLFMRVSLGIHGDDIKDAIETYDYMSNKYMTHATPTLFNSGTPQL